MLVFHLEVGGLVLCIALNVAARFVFRWRADAHEKKYHRADDDQADKETPPQSDA